jgi:DNA primase
LHRRFGALHTELQKAEAALAREASEHNLARSRDIQAQLSVLEGTEAVIERFGEASGRHRPTSERFGSCPTVVVYGA